MEMLSIKACENYFSIVKLIIHVHMQDLKKSLVSIAKGLQSTEYFCGKKIIVGTVIVCVLHEILNDRDISLDSVITVIRLLTFQSDFEEKECQELFDLINDRSFKYVMSLKKYA